MRTDSDLGPLIPRLIFQILSHNLPGFMSFFYTVDCSLLRFTVQNTVQICRNVLCSSPWKNKQQRQGFCKDTFLGLLSVGWAWYPELSVFVHTLKMEQANETKNGLSSVLRSSLSGKRHMLMFGEVNLSLKLKSMLKKENLYLLK